MVDDLIEETRDRFNVTSIVISHDMASTFRIAHQAFLVVQGEVIAHGKPDDLANGGSEIGAELHRRLGDSRRRRSRG